MSKKHFIELADCLKALRPEFATSPNAVVAKRAPERTAEQMLAKELKSMGWFHRNTPIAQAFDKRNWQVLGA